MLGRDKKIDAALAEAAGTSLKALLDRGKGPPSSQSSFCVRNILLVSTAYDYFLLEEEGRLSELFKKVYSQRDMGYIPTIRHVGTGSAALKMLDGKWIDLLVVFNPPSDMTVFELARAAKKVQRELMIVYLANNTPELGRMAAMDGARNIDRIFTWQGDGKVFLGIVQFLEDQRNGSSKAGHEGHVVALAMNEIPAYSLAIQVVYEEIWKHLETVLGDDLTHAQRLAKLRRRPTVALARDGAEARAIFKASRGKVLCAIIDVRGVVGRGEGGKALPGILKGAGGKVPILVIDGAEREYKGIDAKVIEGDSPRKLTELTEFIARSLGSEELVLRGGSGEELATVKDLRSLERVLFTLPEEVLERHIAQGDIQRWLVGRMEFELADGISGIASSDKPQGSIREDLLAVVNGHKHRVHQGSVADYSRKSYGSHVRFSRIGAGPMGGKARGLAFIDKVLATYVQDDLFPGVSIYIPRTIVLCTDVFEQFMGQNKIRVESLAAQPDERIAAAFQQGSLPMTVLGDLRAFVEEAKGPLTVRSSSLLEDALFQPFAGIYCSVMLPNSSLETDTRYQELCSAVKFVYASTYFEKARAYIRSTPNRIEDERMGVVIQEVVGKQHGRKFYPDVSGVARSYDYWPFGTCKNTDGTVNLALGLGKTIVDGGMTHRFCPVHPEVSHHASARDMLKGSQTELYAINLDARKKLLEEDDTLVKMDLAAAERDGALAFTASTYYAESDRIYEGIGYDGPRVLDFAPLLHSEAVPLPKIIQLMLKLSEISLGCPVEIEFALNLDAEGCVPAEFAFLQVRSMVAKSDLVSVNIGDHPEIDVLCQTDSAMGNGVIREISDVVYIDSRVFDMARSREAVRSLKKFNSDLMARNRQYMLIGPGRWGSTDPWLGVPVVWSDIAGAKVIVEMPVEARTIDPSQGSHFFQNMSSLRLGYLTMMPKYADAMDWGWLEGLLGAAKDGDVVHLPLREPLEVRIDGRTGRAVVLKRSGKDDKGKGEKGNGRQGR